MNEINPIGGFCLHKETTAPYFQFIEARGFERKREEEGTSKRT